VTEAAVSRRCRACGAPESTPFFRLGGVPVQDGLLWPSEAAALEAPTGDIELVFCNRCGYIGNRAFDLSLLRYDPSYDISLHHSPAYRRFIEDLANHLVGTHALEGKTILEIGCGKGDFLHAICSRSGGHGIGFDPTWDGEEAPPSGAVRIVRDFYSERHASVEADLVCCRHVLNSFEDLTGFLGTIRLTLGDRLRTVVYFEVPDGSVVFDRQVVWNVVYEHCSYFTIPSLERLFRAAGFEVLKCAPCFQEEYLGIEAMPAATCRADAENDERIDVLRRDVERFAATHRKKVAYWEERLQAHRASRHRIVLWGAGARAIHFLSLFGKRDPIGGIVDINPHRQGLFLPGTGLRVMAPQDLKGTAPEAILVTNPAFAQEIREQARGLGLTGELLVLD
jgi:SAM-dependent methyltransferase